MGYKSIATAINLLKKYYANATGDTLTIAELFAIMGKSPDDKRAKAYQHAQLSLFRHYDLITSKRSKEGYKPLESITLTDSGKKAIGRYIGAGPVATELAPKPPIEDSYSKQVTITSVRRDIEKLKQMEPELDILFDVKLKELPMDQG